MKRSLVSPFVLVTLTAACASSPPPVSDMPPPPPPAVTSPPPADTAQKPAPAPEPTAEEKAKAEAQKRLADDREDMKKKHAAELARWTPEMKAEAKALAAKTFPSGKAAISAVLAAKFRNPENVKRDAARHPDKTLEHFGFKPTMTVLEVGPGAGWYTELLAPALAAKGKLFVTMNDPNGPKDVRGTFYGELVKLHLETSPELYGKVEPILLKDGAPPALGMEGKLDMALVIRGMHGMVNSGNLGAWLSELHKALKPNGVLGVVQHRANEGAKPEESAKNGYLPEAWVVSQVEAAGFKLAARSDVNANPKDTKDHPKGVWTLPPTFRLGDQDRAKYEAIGESDRMTLKFTKVAKKAAPDAKKAPEKKPAPKK